MLRFNGLIQVNKLLLLVKRGELEEKLDHIVFEDLLERIFTFFGALVPSNRDARLSLVNKVGIPFFPDDVVLF